MSQVISHLLINNKKDNSWGPFTLTESESKSEQNIFYDVCRLFFDLFSFIVFTFAWCELTLKQIEMGLISNKSELSIWKHDSLDVPFI